MLRSRPQGPAKDRSRKDRSGVKGGQKKIRGDVRAAPPHGLRPRRPPFSSEASVAWRMPVPWRRGPAATWPARSAPCRAMRQFPVRGTLRAVRGWRFARRLAHAAPVWPDRPAARRRPQQRKLPFPEALPYCRPSSDGLVEKRPRRDAGCSRAEGSPEGPDDTGNDREIGEGREEELARAVIHGSNSVVARKRTTAGPGSCAHTRRARQSSASVSCRQQASGAADESRGKRSGDPHDEARTRRSADLSMSMNRPCNYSLNPSRRWGQSRTQQQR